MVETRSGPKGPFRSETNVDPFESKRRTRSSFRQSVDISATGSNRNFLSPGQAMPHINGAPGSRQAPKATATARRLSNLTSLTKRSKHSISESAAHGPAHCPFHTLNPACLNNIFRLCNDQVFCRKVLPLVCKRWHTVLREPSDVWQELTLSEIEPVRRPPLEWFFNLEADLGHSVGWVKQRAPGVRSLTIHQKLANEDSRLAFLYESSFVTVFSFTAQFLRELHITNCGSGNLGWSMVKTLARNYPARLTSLALEGVAGHFEYDHWTYVCKLSGLKSLTVSYLPQPEEETYDVMLPNSMSKLIRLEKFSLTCSELKLVDAAFMPLNDLKSLSLIDTKIALLPGGFSDLRELTYLNVGGNHTWAEQPVMRFASDLLGLEELKVLDISDSGLTKLRWFEKHEGLAYNITELRLAGNPFSHPPTIEFFPLEASLRDLDLSRCSLSVLPDGIEDLEQLTRLDVSHNLLVHLPLDQERGGLPSRLRLLIASDNPLPCIPDASEFRPYRHLRKIDLTACPYLEFARSASWMVTAFPRLQTLSLEKGDAGKFKDSTVEWLEKLVEDFKGSGRRDVVQW